MNTPLPAAKPNAGANRTSTVVFVIAVWFGTVMGLVEGLGVLLLHKLDLVYWNRYPASAELIPYSIAVDLALSIAIGIGVILLGRLFPRLAVIRVAAGCLVLLTAYDWLVAGNWIGRNGVVLLSAGLAVAFARWFRKREDQTLRFFRQTVPWTAGAAVVVVIAVSAGLWLREKIAVAKIPRARQGSPNVVVMVIDTLRADHLSSYGYHRATSPNLDGIAAQGALFSRAFAASSWTLPSHASLLTGRQPHEHGAETGLEPLDERYPTIAETLRSCGYRTGAFSGNFEFFTRNGGFGRGFVRFEDYFQSITLAALQTVMGQEINILLFRRFGVEDMPGRPRAADVNRRTLRWMDADHSRPFFVFLNYFDTHDPYLPPQPYRNRFSKVQNPGGIINDQMGRFAPQMTSEQLQGEIDAYDGAISYVDHQIGQFMAELKRRGLTDKTIVVITSDHGESFGEHGLFRHRNALYREVIHVPFIFWGPGRIPANVRVTTPVSNTHLPATLMKLVGGCDQGPFQTRSLLELFEDSASQEGWPVAVAELAQMPFEDVQGAPAYTGWLKSAVTPEWHYILHEKLGPELYEWDSDPLQTRNLAGTEKGREVVNELVPLLVCQDVVAASSADLGGAIREPIALSTGNGWIQCRRMREP